MKVNGSQAEYTPQLQDTESTEYLQLLSSLQSSVCIIVHYLSGLQLSYVHLFSKKNKREDTKMVTRRRKNKGKV